jgi:hypothetical protein
MAVASSLGLKAMTRWRMALARAASVLPSGWYRQLWYADSTREMP